MNVSKINVRVKAIDIIKVALLILGILFMPFCTYAQVGLGIFKSNPKVKLSPLTKSYRINELDIEFDEGFFNENVPWYVFSDRNNNTTYQSPESDIQLKRLDFLQPCYVINQKNDYLELIKYDSSLLNNPKSRKVDRKSAKYLGWIHKSKLLLWRTALKESNSKFFIKTISCFKSDKIFTNFKKYLTKDSVMLFSNPLSSDTLQTKAPVESIYFVFKQSDDGKEYLMGKSEQITADNVKDVVVGWLPREMLQFWGTRLGFQPANDGTADFYWSEFEVGRADSTFVKPYLTKYEVNRNKNRLQNIYPVQKVLAGNNDTTRFIKTGLLTNVLDKSKNQITNILGRPISYPKYEDIVQEQQHLNVVFVVDGGAENGKFMPYVLTLMQNMQMYSDTTHQFQSLKYGAVIYKDNMGGSCTQNSTLSLTNNFNAVARFIQNQQQQIGQCNDGNVTQSVFSGLRQASQLLEKTKNQSNVIVLIGGAGNDFDNGSAGWNEIINRLSYVNARMLVFQTQSLSNAAYNDFVLQGKDLVVKSAANISLLKKEKIVDVRDVHQESVFGLTKRDSGVYYLDYPSMAMTQGYVIFPERGEITQVSLLKDNLIVLLNMIALDNAKIGGSLNHYFSSVGILNTGIDPAYKRHYSSYRDEYLPSSFLKSVSKLKEPFYLPGWIRYQIAPDSVNNIRFGVMISEEEYQQITDNLQMLARFPTYKLNYRNDIYNHLKEVIVSYLKRKKIKVEKGKVTNLSVAEVLESLTGNKSVNPLWHAKTIKMFKQKKKMTMSEVLMFVDECKMKAAWLQENRVNDAYRFYNNGKVYYWLPADKLP
ncbi:type VI secretion system protein TssR domain-containing protein [Pedobacter sp. MW01-1-1]|uniref:type VI secretion system protein TssR domain-containing protein n=1 Tax=Pedobacter sp. MW01-1-1 TaxID=3383027 RepID=UPI003FF0C527